MAKNKHQSVKIIPLGGVGELGKNMYVIEIQKNLYVIDAGLMFPEEEMFGIDIVIPDFTYLIENKNRVKGIFLSHGHEDHTGALPYLLREVDAPVYGTRLTVSLTEAKMRENGFKQKVSFHIVDEDTVLEFPHCSVTFFKVNHSIPDAVGICMHTDIGAIVYTGDFKFDQSTHPLYRANISRMADIGDRGVLCLLSDSTEAEKPGYTTPEVSVSRELESIFLNSPGRIIFACYASSLNAIQRVFDAAAKSGRKVAIAGRELHNVYSIAHKLGYLHLDQSVVVPFSSVSKIPDEELVILMTGNQGEPLEALQQMAKRAHKQLHIQKGDTVLIAASPHRGGELFLIKTIDMLFRAGANVITKQGRYHVSGHGREEELKFMLNLMKPKFFIPIHGEYRMLNAHKKIAMSMGVPEENIVIADKGDVVEIRRDKISLNGRVAAGHVLIDGIGVGDVGNIVLRDRKLLSQDGIFIVVMTISRNERRIVSGPEIISRGFVYVRESEKLIEKSTKMVREIAEKGFRRPAFDWTNVKQEIRDQLSAFLFDETKRRPMIIPIVMEI